MKKNQFLKDALGWGFTLWLVGYVLGIVLYFYLPTDVIGWIITPFGIAITLVVLFTRNKSATLNYYLRLAIAWTLIAVVFDYLFIVKTFHPADGYYKTDVYIYYLSTFILPIVAGWLRRHDTGKKLVHTS